MIHTEPQKCLKSLSIRPLFILFLLFRRFHRHEKSWWRREDEKRCVDVFAGLTRSIVLVDKGLTVLLDVFVGRIACSLDFTNVNKSRTLDVPVLTLPTMRGIRATKTHMYSEIRTQIDCRREIICAGCFRINF